MRKLRKNSKEFKETLDKILKIEGLPLKYETRYDDSYVLRLQNIYNIGWVYTRENLSIIKVSTEEMVMMENWLDSSSYFKDSIYDAYGRPSSAKVSSFDTLEKVYKDGDNTKITGYSCDQYTYCASKTILDGVMLFAKETSCNSYLTIYVIE